MRDRTLLMGGLATLVLGLLGLTLDSVDSWPPTLVDLVRPAARAAVAPPWSGRATGRVSEFRLTVART